MHLSHTDVFALTHPPFDFDESSVHRMPVDASFTRTHLRKTGDVVGFPILEKCEPEDATHLSVEISARMRFFSSSHTWEKRWEVIFSDHRLFDKKDPPEWKPVIIRALDDRGQPLG